MSDEPLEVDCITPGFLDDYDCAWLFPLDAEHFAGEHEAQPVRGCHKCRHAFEPKQLTLGGPS